MTRLPDLGPRGEGWVVLQVVLLAAIVVTGILGPAWDGAARAMTTAAGLVLVASGLVLSVRGIADLGGSITPMPAPRHDAVLVETGVYRHARHPIYGGLIVGAIGWGLLTASPVSLAMAAGLWAFFEAKSRREEAWLDATFEGYAAYRARTRRFIPWPGRSRG